MEKDAITLKDITFDFIEKYCEENDRADWLNIVFEDVEVKTKEGETKIKPISFLQVRNAFVKEFFPELIQPAKPKKLSMRDRVRALNAKK